MTDETDDYFMGLAGKAPAHKTVGPAVSQGQLTWLWAMRFNYMGLAERLRFGFYPPQVALYNGLSKDQFAVCNIAYQTARNKFEEAGGTEAGLQQAILGGWGNGKTSLKATAINKASLDAIMPDLAKMVRTLNMH